MATEDLASRPTVAASTDQGQCTELLFSGEMARDLTAKQNGRQTIAMDARHV